MNGFSSYSKTRKIMKFPPAIINIVCLIGMAIHANELSFSKSLKHIDSLDCNKSTKSEMRQLLAVSKSITYNASNGSEQNIADGLVLMRLTDCVNKHLAMEDVRLFNKMMMEEIKSDGYFDDFIDGMMKSTLWWTTTMSMKAKEENTPRSEIKKFFSCEYSGPLDVTTVKDLKSVKKPKPPKMKAYSDPLIQFYLGEYKKAEKEFIDAKGLLDIFHADIKKDIALDCIQRSIRSKGNKNWINEGAQIRKAISHALIPTGERRKAARKNSDHMERNFNLYDLNLVNHTVVDITNLWGRKDKDSQCQIDRSAEELYQLFLPIYVQKYKEGLTSLRQDPMPNLKDHYIKRDKWLKEITESCQTCGPYRSFEERLIDDNAETEARFFKMAKKQEPYAHIRSLAKGYQANINVTDHEGRTPLFYAIHSNDVKLIKVLLELGSDYNHKDHNGKTVFDYFDKSVPYEIRNLLWVEKYRETHPRFKETSVRMNGKNFVASYRNTDSWTKLMHAVFDNDLKQVRQLLKGGADIDDYNNNKTTALHMGVAKNHKKIVQLLLAKGADIEVKNKHGLTPLFFAVEKENLQMLELLIKHGANIDAVTDMGETPLSYAFINSKKSMIKPLIQNGADVDRPTKHGDTCLFNAVIFGQIELTKLLLENGADIDIKNNAQKYVYDYIRWNTPEAIVKFLQIAYLKKHPEEKAPVQFMVRYKNEMYKPSPIQQALKDGNIEKLRIYLTKLDTDDTKEKTINDLLFRATEKRDPAFIELIIDHGAQLDVRHNDGRTPLLQAIAYNHAAIVKSLIDKGADINALSHGKHANKMSPIQYAALNKRTEIMEILIKAGADVNQKEETNGRTPLMLALTRCRSAAPALQTLLDHGADITRKDDQGMDVFDIAQTACKKRTKEKVLALLNDYAEKAEYTK